MAMRRSPIRAAMGGRGQSYARATRQSRPPGLSVGAADEDEGGPVVRVGERPRLPARRRGPVSLAPGEAAHLELHLLCGEVAQPGLRLPERLRPTQRAAQARPPAEEVLVE